MSFNEGEHEAGVLAALAKAAVMAHWMPGIGLRVEQSGADPIRVAAFPAAGRFEGAELDPCTFRRYVVECLQRQRAGLIGGGRPHGAISIDTFTDTSTRLGPGGVAIRRLDDRASVMAFATLMAGDPCGEIQRRHGATEAPLAHAGGCGQAIRVDFDDDDDLGVTFVHSTLPSDDLAAEHEVFHLMFNLMAACAASEVEGLLAS